MTPPATLSIGELAQRTGLSVSAIRFYEARGLVRATRSAGNQRQFARADIRRLSFALIAQQLGFTLAEIEAELFDPAARAGPDARRVAGDRRAHARRARVQDRHAAKNARALGQLYRMRLPIAC